MVLRLTMNWDDGADDFENFVAAMECGAGVCAAGDAGGVSAG